LTQKEKIEYNPAWIMTKKFTVEHAKTAEVFLYCFLGVLSGLCGKSLLELI